MKTYHTYILASRARGTLYVGVTGDMQSRTYQHETEAVKSFTQKYGVDRLVYFEETNSIEAAITREKQLKNWHRQWKINLIESTNPTRQDVSRAYRMDAETSSA